MAADLVLAEPVNVTPKRKLPQPIPLNRTERRRLRFAARRVNKHIAGLPKRRRAQLRTDYRDIYDQQREWPAKFEPRIAIVCRLDRVRARRAARIFDGLIGLIA